MIVGAPTAAFGLAIAVHRLVADTRVGLLFADYFPTFAVVWLRDIAPLMAVPVILLLAGSIGFRAAVISSVGLATLGWLPIPRVWTILLGLAVAKLEGRTIQPWSAGCAAAPIGFTAIAAVLLLLGHALPHGDVLDPNYIVTWPAMLWDRLPIAIWSWAFSTALLFGPTFRRPSVRGVIVSGGFVGLSALSLVITTLAIRPPCDDYVDHVQTSCSPSCSFSDFTILEYCEAKILSGDLTREGARLASGACDEMLVECAERKERLRLAKRREEMAKLREGIARGNRSVCAQCGPRDVCEALLDIKDVGFSAKGSVWSEYGRSVLQASDGRPVRDVIAAYLSSRGYKHVRGYIIAKVETGIYEAAWLESTYWGYVPSSRRFVLRTTRTDYTTEGRFNLWARKDGTTDVSLKSGFDAEWDVYEEDAFGSVIQNIYDAPTGEATSEAAAAAVTGLCVLSGALD